MGPACPGPHQRPASRSSEEHAGHCEGRDPSPHLSPQTCARHLAQILLLEIHAQLNRKPREKTGVTQHLVTSGSQGPSDQACPCRCPPPAWPWLPRRRWPPCRLEGTRQGREAMGRPGPGTLCPGRVTWGSLRASCLQMGAPRPPRAGEATAGTGDLPAARSGFQVARAERARSQRGGSRPSSIPAPGVGVPWAC